MVNFDGGLCVGAVDTARILGWCWFGTTDFSYAAVMYVWAAGGRSDHCRSGPAEWP